MVQSQAAGYDGRVAGFDEPSARAALAAMQDQLARDPTTALGLSATPSSDDVRSAFLALTKQFHPVRFGRMATDVQKLANEVFLALRAAHDALAKSASRPSGPIPGGGRATGSGASGAITSPAARPPVTPGPRPAVPRTMTPTSPTANRPGSPPARPLGTAVGPPARPPGPANPLRQSGATPIAQASPISEASVLDLLQRQQWDQARSALHQLIARDPSAKRVRALMAYARGREAQLDRRLDDARVELQDALDLDPTLELAKTALTELFTRRK
jgi:hypothetical protein